MTGTSDCATLGGQNCVNPTSFGARKCVCKVGFSA